VRSIGRDGSARGTGDDNGRVSDAGTTTDRSIRPWVAAVADLAVLFVFVAIGRRTHHEDAGVVGFFRVLWPFAVGMVVGWAATGLARAPLDWRRAVAAWLLTVAVGMTLRVLAQGHEFKASFTIVALVFTGVCMLGWRAAVRFARRRA
jgi:peptidoglycan/LPS O-acetylase OafA/YrhL